MQSALDLQAESLVAWLNAPAKRPVNAFNHVAGWYFAAPYGVYATRDGHLALSLSPLSALAEATGERRLASFSSEDSWTRQDEITALIADVLKTGTTDEWVARLEPLEIWHAPVQGYAEIAADPQVAHMKSLVTVKGTGETGAPLTLVNHPVLYDGETAEVRLPPQRLGAQTAQVLAELGYEPAEIEALVRDGVVKLADRQ
jgi:crotonobetainyl-CoA:carnitine CoA-transferase CaiB-like acyl-CoA transferase